MNLACPKCTGSEARKLSLIYDEGRSTIRTQGTTSGAGFGGGGVGFGTATTSSVGHQQTALSKQASPPAKRPWLLLAGLAAICGMFTLGGLSSPGVGTLIMLALTAWAGFTAMKWRAWNRNVQPELHERWSHSWMCSRCGEIFVAT